MMKKIFASFFRVITALFVVIALLLCAAFGVMQTRWFKTKIALAIEQRGNGEGIELQIGAITGMAPISFSIEEVALNFAEGSSLSLEGVKIRISLLDLMRKKLTVSYLSVDKAIYYFTEPSMTWDELKQIKLHLPKLQAIPFSIATRHIAIRSFELKSDSAHQISALSIYGKGKIKHDLSEIILSLKISKENNPNIYTKLLIDGSEKKGELDAVADLFLPSTKILYPIIDLPFDGKIEMKSKWKGSWGSWKAAVFDGIKSNKPLSITFSAHVNQLQVKSHPFLSSDWKIKGAFQLFAGDRLLCKTLSIASKYLSSESVFSVRKEGVLTHFQTTFSASDLSPFSSVIPCELQGSMSGMIRYGSKGAELMAHTDKIKIGDVEARDLQLKCKLKERRENWNGQINACLKVKEEELTLSSALILKDAKVYLNEIEVQGVGASLDGEAFVDRERKNIKASIFAKAKDMRTLRPLLPFESNISGSIALSSDATCDFSDELTLSTCGHLTVNNGRYFDKLIEKLDVSFSLDDIFHKPRGKIEIEAHDLMADGLYLSHLTLSSREDELWHPFTLSFDGIWKKKIEAHIEGQWRKEGDDFEIELFGMQGKALGYPIALTSTCQIVLGSDRRSITDLALSIDKGAFFLEVEESREAASIDTTAEHIPLDILFIPDKGITASGAVSFEGSLELAGKGSAGHFNLALENAELSHEGEKKELKAKGSLQAHLQDGTLQLFSHLYGTNQQFLDMTLTAPVAFSPFSLSAQIERTRPLSAELTAEGELEALFDFINIGAQKAEGLLTAHLFLSNTLSCPSLQGEASLQNGRYENYAIGTRLKEMRADVVTESSSLVLKHFEAKGKEGGVISAVGSMQLRPDLHMPYDVEAKLSDLKFLNFDYLSTELTGDLTLLGTQMKATLSGSVQASKASVSLAEEIPVRIPELDITYVNRPIHLEGKSLKAKEPFPLYYDVMIGAKDRIFVKGRGLESEWKGDLHLTGQNSSIKAGGSLELIKGDYTFAGKKFSLQDGLITFHDTPSSQAFIKMTGNLALADVQVTVHIQGPLERPTFTMQSMPYMPTSALLARILFNKDISDITAVQALQLANVLVSMSGATGPDVLESIRRSIGVDRLTIVGKEGSDEVSLQIGWYLTHGVTVSLSQSATSSDVTVEVDLKHGFIFQAETQNQEEGKFSLKWNKNY